MERLWGDNFFDPASKKWSKKHSGTATCKCAAPPGLPRLHGPAPCAAFSFIHNSAHG